MMGRDKSAWCQVVIQPLLKSALKLCANRKLLLQSIQTQATEPSYLPLMPRLDGSWTERQTSHSRTHTQLPTLLLSMPAYGLTTPSLVICWTLSQRRLPSSAALLRRPPMATSPKLDTRSAYGWVQACGKRPSLPAWLACPTSPQHLPSPPLWW